jgi:flagellar basal body-associated protein FliL
MVNKFLFVLFGLFVVLIVCGLFVVSSPSYQEKVKLERAQETEHVDNKEYGKEDSSSTVFLTNKGLRPGVDIGGGYHYDLYSGKVEWGYGF